VLAIERTESRKWAQLPKHSIDVPEANDRTGCPQKSYQDIIPYRKKARGFRLFSLVLPKQDVVGSNPITRSTEFRFSAKASTPRLVLALVGSPFWGAGYIWLIDIGTTLPYTGNKDETALSNCVLIFCLNIEEEAGF
jgi:hypothetical protein